MNSQIARFPDGGFACHKIVFVSENGHFSAWFDRDGKLLDAEQHFRGVRPVKKDGPIWRLLRPVGTVHRLAQAS